MNILFKIQDLYLVSRSNGNITQNCKKKLSSSAFLHCYLTIRNVPLINSICGFVGQFAFDLQYFHRIVNLQ